ncbi:hypothetical protein [Rhizobium sp. WYJ-E13]|uniref:hypothetical protein n=1 Tax=unclassified Rhizobium TaxID=2613769 RepID=UPI001C1EE1CB|nr:hypothetical protein [Rhizobium sp. WYJ-E13]QWW69250.1 hypothetical protein KQ933_05965 [Rhizobium sp. WYJ-E13]
MRKSLIAASLLAIGMTSSAFAQSNPDTIGPTNGGSTDPNSGNYSSDYTSDSNGIHPVPAGPVDPTMTQSIGGQAIECPGMPQQNTGIDTRGGESGASISEACREYDN